MKMLNIRVAEEPFLEFIKSVDDLIQEYGYPKSTAATNIWEQDAEDYLVEQRLEAQKDLAKELLVGYDQGHGHSHWAFSPEEDVLKRVIALAMTPTKED